MLQLSLIYIRCHTYEQTQQRSNKLVISSIIYCPAFKFPRLIFPKFAEGFVQFDYKFRNLSTFDFFAQFY